MERADILFNARKFVAACDGLTAGRNIVFVPDRYFIFDEINFPVGTLKKKEIYDMARTKIASLPISKSEGILSGFFVRKSEDAVVTFVVSKERLMAEIPDFGKFSYCLPVRFLREFLVNKLDHYDENAGSISYELTPEGRIRGQGQEIKIFSRQFGTAELLRKFPWRVDEIAGFVNGCLHRILTPMLSIACIFVITFACVILGHVGVSAMEKYITSDAIKVERIVKRNGIRDELINFTSERLACPKFLKLVNDMRPKNLLFDGATFYGPKKMQFVGRCKNISILDALLTKLKNEKSIASVDVANTSTFSAETTFDFIVNFL